MESSDSFFDSEEEVKKLQELVKKLEEQNEQLRSKQKHSLPNGDAVSFMPNNNEVDSAAESLKGADEGDLEDVDVLDVDNLSLKDEEDSWLYSSPKPPTPQQSNINLYKWVRQDFDHPSPEMETARRSLLSKLEEAARMNRSSSTPALGTITSPTRSSASQLSRSTEESQKSYARPHQKRSLLSMTGNRPDSGMLARTKKSYNERRGSPASERGEEEKYQHEVTDVERLAKQQEESLRQSMATYTSPKRVIHNKSMSIASDTDNSGSPVGSNRSSPARFDYEGSFIGRHRNSFGSDNGTPPDSPRILLQHSSPLSEIQHSGVNLSNKSCLQYPPPSSHSSDSSLEQQSAGSTDDLHLMPDSRSASRLPAPGFRSVSPAMGGIRPGLASPHGPSPQRSGLPTPRRGIPRPASAAVRSSLPTLRRSGIPSARPPSSQGREENWREGCF